MDVLEQTQGAVRVIKPVGALVSADIGAFKETFVRTAKTAVTRVLIDMTGVPYVDSQGVETLVGMTEHLAVGGRSLKLCGVTPTVRKVIELTGWLGEFEFYADVPSGVRSFL